MRQRTSQFLIVYLKYSVDAYIMHTRAIRKNVKRREKRKEFWYGQTSSQYNYYQQGKRHYFSLSISILDTVIRKSQYFTLKILQSPWDQHDP